MIKILHEKMLNAIHLCLFHNDTSEENNSLNGHLNEKSSKIFLVIAVATNKGNEKVIIKFNLTHLLINMWKENIDSLQSTQCNEVWNQIPFFYKDKFISN